MTSAFKCFLFFGCYVVCVLVFLSFLSQGLRADEGVWALFGLSFAITTIAALVVACALPLSYCTVLKAVGLAGVWGILVFVLGWAVA